MSRGIITISETGAVTMPTAPVWMMQFEIADLFGVFSCNVRKAIRIENGSITPTYIQYLWVRQQSDLSNKTVIYVPTETNLPILESTRMNQIQKETTTP